MKPEDLDALAELLKRSAFPEGHFHTAELDDDTVVIRDRAGNPTAWMSLAAFLTVQDVEL